MRAGAGEYYVLEDNLRVPVRRVVHAGEPQDDDAAVSGSVRPQPRGARRSTIPDLLLENLRSVAPQGVERSAVVLLTPGMYNWAYFEHAFLAQQMGDRTGRGQDLFVRDERVYMRTTRGPQRVDVIYRRIDDDFLDPLAFRPDSLLGVPGLLSVYRAGRVTLANAIGTGIADDKSIYPYVPDMIDFYLGEKPILDNVPTYMSATSEDLAYTLDAPAELVVKEVHGAGGYGMLVGPARRKREIEASRARIARQPGELHRAADAGVVDLPDLRRAASRRATSICGRSCCRAGRSRWCRAACAAVALREGSLVVNSSQGGGTKDTWVLER